MTTESDDAPRIVVRYSLSDAEVRAYWRASSARQQNAARGRQLSWIAYLGAFPVSIVGGYRSKARADAERGRGDPRARRTTYWRKGLNFGRVPAPWRVLYKL